MLMFDLSTMFKTMNIHLTLPQDIYTQTKKKRPIFMVLYLSIQLRCCNKIKTKMIIKRQTHKKW